jgi:chlorophyllide a reductase subunit Y
MGPAGAGSLAQVVNTAVAGRERFDRMKPSSTASASGDTAGIWDRARARRAAKAG